MNKCTLNCIYIIKKQRVLFVHLKYLFEKRMIRMQIQILMLSILNQKAYCNNSYNCWVWVEILALAKLYVKELHWVCHVSRREMMISLSRRLQFSVPPHLTFTYYASLRSHKLLSLSYHSIIKSSIFDQVTEYR